MKFYYFFTLLSLFSGCNGCKTCQKNFTFELPLTLSLSKSEYKVGDTLTITSKFSKDMVDVITREKIKVENYDFIIRMYLGQIDTKPTRVANTFFNIKTEVGNIEAQSFQISDTALLGGVGLTHQLSYQENQNDYTLICKIVPTKKGLFRIAFASRVNDSDTGILKDCNSTVDFLKFNMNNRINNYYEFLQTSPDENIKKISKEEFDRDGYYAFYVK